MSDDGEDERSPTLMSKIAQELPWNVLEEGLHPSPLPCTRGREDDVLKQNAGRCVFAN
jgi:hypothetical protein